MKTKRLASLILTALLLAITHALADPPMLLNYPGRLNLPARKS